MASSGEARTDTSAGDVLGPAWSLRWRAPELALLFAERAGAVAKLAGDGPDRLRAEATVVVASCRLGQRLGVVERAIDAIRLAERHSDGATTAMLRVELAGCARSAGVPLVGAAVLRPVLTSNAVRPTVRADALVQMVGCLAQLTDAGVLDEALAEADRLYAEDRELDPDSRVVLRALLRSVASGEQRRRGDARAAVDAAQEGADLLASLNRPSSDNGEVGARVALRLVHGLLDLGRVDEAGVVASVELARPVRAPAAAAIGWLALAMAVRKHLAAGAPRPALALLRDAAELAERHRLGSLRAEALTTLSDAHERVGQLAEALDCLRTAQGVRLRRARAVYAARTKLVGAFGETTSPEEFVRLLDSPGGRRAATGRAGGPGREQAAALLGRFGMRHPISAAVTGARTAAPNTDVTMVLVDLTTAGLGVTASAGLIGEQVVSQVLDRVRDAAPTEAQVARVGGAEFAVLLPSTQSGQTERWVEQLRGAIAKVDWGTFTPGLAVNVRVAVAQVSGRRAAQPVRVAAQMATPDSAIADSSIAERATAGTATAGTATAGTATAGTGTAGTGIANAATFDAAIADTGISGTSFSAPAVPGSSIPGSSISATAIPDASVRATAIPETSIRAGGVAATPIAEPAIFGSVAPEPAPAMPSPAMPSPMPSSPVPASPVPSIPGMGTSPSRSMFDLPTVPILPIGSSSGQSTDGAGGSDSDVLAKALEQWRQSRAGQLEESARPQHGPSAQAPNPPAANPQGQSGQASVDLPPDPTTGSWQVRSQPGRPADDAWSTNQPTGQPTAIPSPPSRWSTTQWATQSPATTSGQVPAQHGQAQPHPSAQDTAAQHILSQPTPGHRSPDHHDPDPNISGQHAAPPQPPLTQPPPQQAPLTQAPHAQAAQAQPPQAPTPPPILPALPLPPPLEPQRPLSTSSALFPPTSGHESPDRVPMSSDPSVRISAAEISNAGIVEPERIEPESVDTPDPGLWAPGPPPPEPPMSWPAGDATTTAETTTDPRPDDPYRSPFADSPFADPMGDPDEPSRPRHAVDADAGRSVLSSLGIESGATSSGGGRRRAKEDPEGDSPVPRTVSFDDFAHLEPPPPPPPPAPIEPIAPAEPTEPISGPETPAAQSHFQHVVPSSTANSSSETATERIERLRQDEAGPDQAAEPKPDNPPVRTGRRRRSVQLADLLTEALMAYQTAQDSNDARSNPLGADPSASLPGPTSLPEPLVGPVGLDPAVGDELGYPGPARHSGDTQPGDSRWHTTRWDPSEERP